MQTFTGFLKEQFAKDGVVIKSQFQEKYDEWYIGLEDETLDNLAQSWKEQEDKAMLKEIGIYLDNIGKPLEKSIELINKLNK